MANQVIITTVIVVIVILLVCALVVTCAFRWESIFHALGWRKRRSLNEKQADQRSWPEPRPDQHQDPRDWPNLPPSPRSSKYSDESVLKPPPETV
jgi:hypothetical protein